MPRERTGNLFWADDHWAVRVTICTDPVIRHRFHFEPAITKPQRAVRRLGRGACAGASTTPSVSMALSSIQPGLCRYRSTS